MHHRRRTGSRRIPWPGLLFPADDHPVDNIDEGNNPGTTRRESNPDESVSAIARLLGISRTTLYKYLPELTAVEE
ncbi:helix-turn-helix domain-containing protein [Nocardia sp. NPDC024068]|uniref:helix-turn-helix domain-containing protein n=1 Tax=Nocardia sp. NPDC024068 TaxID=3157197 RepID=UPI0033E8663A